MGAGMIVGKKRTEDDSDVAWWLYFGELMGDDDLVQLAQGAMNRPAKSPEQTDQEVAPDPDAVDSFDEEDTDGWLE